MLSPRPSWAAMRVLKASLVLTPIQKLVALEIYGLDNRDKPAGRACFAKADTLADRLGTRVRTVEGVLSDLVAYGILEAVRGFQRADRAIVLPSDSCPSSDRISPDKLTSYREAFDAYVEFRKKETTPGGGE